MSETIPNLVVKPTVNSIIYAGATTTDTLSGYRLSCNGLDTDSQPKTFAILTASTPKITMKTTTYFVGSPNGFFVIEPVWNSDLQAWSTETETAVKHKIKYAYADDLPPVKVV